MTSKSQFSSCLISFHGGLLLKVPRPPGNWAWASRGLMLEYVWNTWGMCKFMKIKGLTSHDNLGKKSFNYSWTVWLWDWNLLIEICSSNDSSQSLLSASQFGQAQRRWEEVQGTNSPNVVSFTGFCRGRPSEPRWWGWNWSNWRKKCRCR